MATEHVLFDYHYSGTFNANGLLKKVYNIDALENALRMWFVSIAGEVVRLPLLGGYLIDMLYKPMMEDSIADYKAKIQAGFVYNFQPYSIISNLEIVPNYVTKTWEIDMDINTVDLDYTYHFSVGIKNQT